jgi:hypothetical protein
VMTEMRVLDAEMADAPARQPTPPLIEHEPILPPCPIELLSNA